MRVLFALLIFLGLRHLWRAKKPKIDYSKMPRRMTNDLNIVALLILTGSLALGRNNEWWVRELWLIPTAVFFIAVDTWRRRWYMKNIYPTVVVPAAV